LDCNNPVCSDTMQLFNDIKLAAKSKSNSNTNLSKSVLFSTLAFSIL